jgi:EthD domain
MSAAKGIYLAPRHPVLDRNAFRDRWRQHHALGKTIGHHANILRLEQCDVLQGDTVVPGQGHTLSRLGFSDDYFGVCAMSLGRDAVVNITGHPRYQELRSDELETFGAYAENFATFADASVAWDDGGTEIKLFLFISRRPGLTKEEFARHWRERRPGFEASARKYVTSYVQNLIPDPEPGWAQEWAAKSSLSVYDGIAEVGFAGLEDLGRMLNDGMDDVKRDKREFVDESRRVNVVTRVNVLLPVGDAGPTT